MLMYIWPLLKDLIVQDITISGAWCSVDTEGLRISFQPTRHGPMQPIRATLVLVLSSYPKNLT